MLLWVLLIGSAIGFALGSADTAVAMGGDDCLDCHLSTASHYHLSPGKNQIACYSYCHFTGTGPWADYIRTLHEYDEGAGTTYDGSDHLTDPCDFCHQPAHPDMPQHTAEGTAAAHDSITPGCDDCHGPSLLTAHESFPTCAGCHGVNAPTRVKTAIANDDASCEACHDINPVTSHPGPSQRTWADTAYYTWQGIAHVGANPANPGVHGGYAATTAKCGICHSVHRATAQGAKLLDTATATCVGCHQAGGTTVTSVVVSWEEGGPHGAGDPSSCLSVACHVSNPHGAGGSEYKIVAAKLLSPAADAALAAAVAAGPASGITAANLNAELSPAEGAGTRPRGRR